MLRQLLALLLLAALPALVSGMIQLQWQPAQTVAEGEVLPATARLWGRHVLWVDARPLPGFHSAHIPGAVPLQADHWPEQLPGFFREWNSEKTVVVYGETRDDPTARAIAERLRRELKIEAVYVLKGGWQEWKP